MMTPAEELERRLRAIEQRLDILEGNVPPTDLERVRSGFEAFRKEAREADLKHPMRGDPERLL